MEQWFCEMKWLVLLGFIELSFIICMVMATVENPTKWLSIKKHWWKFALMILFCLPIIIYVYNFGGRRFSENPADWGTFGDYVGGVYSVVLTLALVYVSYTINRKTEENKECKKAIKEIYTIVSKIQSVDVNLEEVHGILRCIDENSLHLSKEVREKLIHEMDYYICIANNKSLINGKTEERIKDVLKQLYNEY